MLLDAALYSLGAIRPIRAGVKASDAYWDRRLLLNLLLANMGLYFTALFTLIGAFLAGTTPQAAQLVLLLGLVVCLYSGVSVTLLTPKDWPHTVPRVLAAILIGSGFFVATEISRPDCRELTLPEMVQQRRHHTWLPLGRCLADWVAQTRTGGQALQSTLS